MQFLLHFINFFIQFHHSLKIIWWTEMTHCNCWSMQASLKHHICCLELMLLKLDNKFNLSQSAQIMLHTESANWEVKFGSIWRLQKDNCEINACNLSFHLLISSHLLKDSTQIIRNKNKNRWSIWNRNPQNRIRNIESKFSQLIHCSIVFSETLLMA